MDQLKTIINRDENGDGNGRVCYKMAEDEPSQRILATGSGKRERLQ